MSKKKRKSNFWLNAKILATLAFTAYISMAANGWLPIDGTSPNVAIASVATIPVEDIPVRITRQETQPLVSTKIKPHVIGVVGPIRSIPDNLNNYRARGATPDQLRQFFTTSGVTKLMNLSGDIPGKISGAEARAVCTEANVEYLTSGDLNRFAARSGYQEGRGFVRSAAAAARYLAGGNVLVIDRSGNRTGALVGAYLISVHGFTVEQAIMHNNWEQFARNPGNSFKYLETVTGKSEKPE